MNDYGEWARRHPAAAAELAQLIGGMPWAIGAENKGKSEGWAQQQVRIKAAHAGAYSWRNNVGSTPAKCPDCGAKHPPVRFGLANDSTALNEKMKSSDLILAIPRLISPEMVGTTIAQFGSIECKRPGWKYSGKGREAGQSAWLALVQSMGGYATFSTGGVDLNVGYNND